MCDRDTAATDDNRKFEMVPIQTVTDQISKQCRRDDDTLLVLTEKLVQSAATEFADADSKLFGSIILARPLPDDATVATLKDVFPGATEIAFARQGLGARYVITFSSSLSSLCPSDSCPLASTWPLGQGKMALIIGLYNLPKHCFRADYLDWIFVIYFVILQLKMVAYPGMCIDHNEMTCNLFG